MATAEERRRLHDRLEGAIGAGSAGTMIDMLAEMATKDDVAALATRADLVALETRILARFDREAAGVATQIASARQDAAAQSAAVRQDIASLALSGRTMLFGVAAILVAQVAAVAAVAALG
ncbi:MAG TPA: hypothetical protein VMN58_13735 [Acidimicrobiales bacterium]|nr:hypothetical protein [Acidimicrobiales bacterium]